MGDQHLSQRLIAHVLREEFVLSKIDSLVKVRWKICFKLVGSMIYLAMRLMLNRFTGLFIIMGSNNFVDL